MRLRFPRRIGARLIKTGLAVTLATGLMSFVDPTHGLVGAGVSAALMISPSEQTGKQWAKTQFFAAALGALVGAVVGQLIGWAPWLSGLVVMGLILAFTEMGLTAAIGGGLSNCLFILEHADHGWKFAAFRFLASVAGLVIGWAVNRFILPYRPPVLAEDQVATAAD
jgi:uncharacterized membrane protein YgaE (UPF0421/DUF939 family)